MTKKTPKFRSAYNHGNVRQLVTFDPSKDRTKQEFKDQTDVNKIVAAYTKTGRLELLQKAQGFYADLSQGPQSYQEALNLVIHTRNAFDALPADVRAVYQNDPQLFMQAAHDNPEGLFELLKPLQLDENGMPLPPPRVSKPSDEAPSPQETPVDGPVS